MGQAKRRGTFEQRLAAAKIRNEALRGAIGNHPNLMRVVKQRGIAAVATMIAVGDLRVWLKKP